MHTVTSISISLDELQELIEKSVRNALAQHHNNDPPKNAEIEYISRNEVCKILNISLPTLKKFYGSTGEIKAYRLGGKIFFKKAEVEQALKLIHTIKHSRRDIG